jgi:hypothetical protein
MNIALVILLKWVVILLIFLLVKMKGGDAGNG